MTLVQAVSERTRSESMCGINHCEKDFEHIAFKTRSVILDGKSPERICLAKPSLSSRPPSSAAGPSSATSPCRP